MTFVGIISDNKSFQVLNENIDTQDYNLIQINKSMKLFYTMNLKHLSNHIKLFYLSIIDITKVLLF